MRKIKVSGLFTIALILVSLIFLYSVLFVHFFGNNVAKMLLTILISILGFWFTYKKKTYHKGLYLIFTAFVLLIFFEGLLEYIFVVFNMLIFLALGKNSEFFENLIFKERDEEFVDSPEKSVEEEGLEP